ncbi:hypothetical protein [Bacillus massiliglaciei]|uniref:hypothetical protein n=1 Tax=Bacillus massiliglaciei TaxID=1816693 RepID=UPI000DA6116B|nr:hypothetical protein [Bacillus massiliglaciei]
MNPKIIITVTALLVISLFANIALGFNLSNENSKNEKMTVANKELKEKIKGLEQGLDEAEGIITDEQLAGNEEAKNLVEKFFKYQYDYNSDTYKERFEKIKPLVNKEVYGQLTTAGISDIPNVRFENKIQKLKIYLTADNKELSGLVLLDSVYKFEGVESPETTQIFQVKIEEKKGQKQIVSLETLGTFASMSES